MSTGTGGLLDGRVGTALRVPGRVSQWLAVLSAAVLVGGFTSVLYGVTTVVGDPELFLAAVAGTLVFATVVSRVAGVRTATAIAALALAAGLWSYAAAIPADVLAGSDRIAEDVVALLGGMSVLRLREIELWVLALTPAPVFLTWYLALRRRYVAAATTGGLTLSFFILTGDLETTAALAGVMGALGTVGFGRLEHYGGASTPVETLTVVLAGVVLLTTLVSVVPGGTAQPFGLLDSEQDRTLEGSLVSTGERVGIQGSIELSGERRFTVEADRRSYWRAASYDRYTGDGWVRTGSLSEYDGGLSGPPGRGEAIRQEYTVESSVAVMPAAWRPVSVSGSDSDNALVASDGSLQPASAFQEGASYRVESRRPVAPPRVLAETGRDYPERIRERYTQLPASTPDRVRERTSRITANADTPYETVRVVERWLENNREYSLSVDRPSGNVADAFLFEMERGYCTYYATTMVTMLRSQDIPARFVVGYTPGERTGGEYVVRGLDSHAWVEVYFPETGWVRFDPTPADPRQAAERDRLAQENGTEAGPTGPATVRTTAATEQTTAATATESAETTAAPSTPAGGSFNDVPGGDRSEEGLPLPSGEQAAFGVVVLAGVVAGIRRSGAGRRLYRAVWVRYQPRRDPAADTERAFERVAYLLERTGRPRRVDETPRQYLAAVADDDRVWTVYEAYERARYAGSVSAAEAETAVAAADEFVAARLRLASGR